MLETATKTARKCSMRGAKNFGTFDELTEYEFKVSLEAVNKHCLLAWAMTYQKVQGSTEAGTVMLHNTSNEYFRRSHLYVGLSRVTDGGNAFIKGFSRERLGMALGSF
jgi:ATP-dependent exoDNAse (exonuclease V) alpha subunit